jgi:cell division septal protein FtsQ
VVGTIVVGVLIGAGVFLWSTNLLKVNVIEVVGQETISYESIVQIVDLKGNENIFVFDTKELENKIKMALPLVKTVHIRKEFFPNKLRIIIEERTPIAIWEQNQQQYLIDNEGIVVGAAGEEQLLIIHAYTEPVQQAVIEGSSETTSAEQEPAAVQGEEATTPEDTSTVVLPVQSVVEIGGQVVEGAFVQYIVTLAYQLVELIPSVRVIDAFQLKEDQIRVATEGGVSFFFTPEFTIESQLNRLKQTLEEAQARGIIIRQYIDMRFDKVYYQ